MDKKEPIAVLLTLLLLVLSVISTYADIVNASITTDKNDAYLGDVINLTVNLNAPKDYKIDIPNWKDVLSNFDVQELQPETAIKGDIKEYKFNFKITPFIIKNAVIKKITFNYEQPDKKKGSFIIPEKEIKIKELVKKDDKDIKDIKRPLDVSYPKYFFPFIILIAVIIIAILVFLIRYFLKKKKAKADEKALETIPPYEKAMLMLDELKKSGYPEKGEMKKFFTLLSDTLRHYIEARYEIPVLDRTTNELFVEMKKSAMGPSIMDTVKQILVFSDLVKFAKMMPAVDESGNMLEKTYDIIKVMHQAFENQFKESEKA